MKSATALTPLAPAPIDVLVLRGWARAYLWHVGEYELAEAIDPLAEFAARAGLDVDRAQKILAEQFSQFREAEQ